LATPNHNRQRFRCIAENTSGGDRWLDNVFLLRIGLTLGIGRMGRNGRDLILVARRSQDLSALGVSGEQAPGVTRREMLRIVPFQNQPLIERLSFYDGA
jgi:hypothetical protein